MVAEGGGLEPPGPLRAVPVFETGSLANSVIPPGEAWYARLDLNQRPSAPEADALSN